MREDVNLYLHDSLQVIFDETLQQCLDSFLRSALR